MATTSLRVFMGAGDWDSGSTTRANSNCLFSKFIEEFPGPPRIQAVFFHLSNEQRDADLDRPTRCRHIQERGSAPPNPRPDFPQSSTRQSVIELDRPTLSGIISVPDTAETRREYSRAQSAVRPSGDNSPRPRRLYGEHSVGKARNFLPMISISNHPPGAAGLERAPQPAPATGCG